MVKQVAEAIHPCAAQLGDDKLHSARAGSEQYLERVERTPLNRRHGCCLRTVEHLVSGERGDYNVDGARVEQRSDHLNAAVLSAFCHVSQRDDCRLRDKVVHPDALHRVVAAQRLLDKDIQEARLPQGLADSVYASQRQPRARLPRPRYDGLRQ